MSSILIFFIVFAGILIVGIAAYRRTEWFLYLYLLGLPFDHVTFTVGPMRVSVSDFALVALLVSWLMRFFFKGEQRLCYPVQVYLGLMLMIFVVGATMRNFETIEGVRLSFSFIVKICSYFLLLQFIRNEKELTKSIKMIMIGAGLATLLAIYQQYAFISGGMPKLKTVMMEGAVSGLNYNFPYAPLRPLAGMNHSAAFGSYLTFPLALLLGIFFFRMPLKYRLWALIPTILMFLVLVMNDTRAAYFSILISFLICMMLGNNKLRYSLFVLLMMAPILIVPVYEFLFFHRETSVATRQEVLPIVFEFALQNPLGGGILFFQKTNEMQLGAHSSFLQMLTFGGIPAMLIYLYILVSIFFQFRKSFNGIWSIRDNYPMRYAFIIILSAIFVGALITSELVHPRTTNKDHWAFLAIFFLTPLFSEAAVEDEKRIKFENST